MGLTGMGPGQAAVGPTGGPLPRELDGTWSVLAGDRTAPGNFQSPTGLAVDTQGNVYVDDTQNFRIEKLSPAGQFITAFGDYGNGDGQFTLANGLAVDRAGNIYVADTESSSIEKLSPRGYPLAEWNQYGSAPGELEYPTDIAVDRSGNMYVTDGQDHRVQKLSPRGKPLAIWGSKHPKKGGL
jgi:sugar lactone lactonase YvrE